MVFYIRAHHLNTIGLSVASVLVAEFASRDRVLHLGPERRATGRELSCHGTLSQRERRQKDVIPRYHFGCTSNMFKTLRF